MSPLLFISMTIISLAITFYAMWWFAPSTKDDRLRKQFAKAKEGKTRCTGYRYGNYGMLYDDCKAHQSKSCEDGRCRLHCQEMCKCEVLDVPALKKFVRQK